MSNRTFRVHVDLGGSTVPAGTVTFHEGRGRTSTTFNYDAEYVRRRDSYDIDPRLPLHTTSITISGLPGAFEDASPDRWGQNLIRREADRLSGGRRNLTSVDFLLEASDVSRQGALRFCVGDDQTYLEEHGEVPKRLDLERLVEASHRAQQDDDYPVSELLDAGSGTLGGARPKASVIDEDGGLMIAKFPSVNDDWDVIRWEQTALELSGAAGVDRPASRLLEVGNQPVVVIDRFDRDRDRRLGYLSAHTLIGDETYAADYEDIAEALSEYSDDYRSDSEELFRRAAFSVGIHNTDDHLRNHGIIRTSTGWRLSPAFDINPNPRISGSRSTGISGAYRADEEASGLAGFARETGLTDQRASQILEQVRSGISEWKQVALAHGLDDAETRRFSPMFGRQDEVLAEAVHAIGHSTRERPAPISARATYPGEEQPRDAKGRFGQKRHSQPDGSSHILGLDDA